jgi:hypothetical protein
MTAPSVNTTCSAASPKIAERPGQRHGNLVGTRIGTRNRTGGTVAAEFGAASIVGLVATVAILAYFRFAGSRTREYPPFRPLVTAAGGTGSAAGGLVAIWAGFGNLAIAISCSVGFAVVLLVVYKVMVPWLRRRRDATSTAPSPRTHD